MKSITRHKAYWKRRNFFSAIFLLLVLSFLTVSNTFLYGAKASAKYKTAMDGKKSERPLPNNEEEKSNTGSSISNSMQEEYLHEHNFFLHNVADNTHTHAEHFYHFYVGKNYAQLHAQPPDLA